MPEIYGNTVNFTMFFPVFYLNFDGLRYPIKESCHYKVVTHGSEVCLHSHHPNSCNHYTIKVEHLPEECIGMFHCRSDLRYPEVPAYAFYRKWMPPYGSIHGSIDPSAF